MAGKRRLIVGLGNPSPRYQATRHNVGFAVLDHLIGKGTYRTDGRARALVADRRLRGRSALLVKPQTFMNRSGYSVRHLARRYSLPPECILVVVDDLNLPLGDVRLRAQGSAGGHNGLQDIIDELGTRSVARVRVGIGGEYERGQQSRFVLTPFTADEQATIDAAVKRAAQAVTVFVTDGITTAMNRFNRRRRNAARPESAGNPPKATASAAALLPHS